MHGMEKGPISDEELSIKLVGFFDSVSGISKSLSAVATHIKYLGVGDAGTTMGAIEFLAVSIKEGSSEIATGLHAIAEAIAEHGRS